MGPTSRSSGQVVAAFLALAVTACAQVPPAAAPATPAAPVSGPKPEAPRPAALEIKLDKSAVRAGESFTLVIEAVNRSTEPLKFKNRQVFLNLRLNVRQPDGTCAFYNPYNRLRVNPVDTFEWTVIPPGGRLEIARISPKAGEPFEARAWTTYKYKGRPVDWYERFPLGPDGLVVDEPDVPKPFVQKGLHNLHASYALIAREPGAIVLTESAVVDLTVSP